jgi:hypothetical protein
VAALNNAAVDVGAYKPEGKKDILRASNTLDDFKK